jgi:diacylglycerol kinase (ATP)
MSVLVIANPRSRAGATGEKLPDVERALRRQGLAYELVCTQRPGHATEIARARREVEVIAVVGGDGTLNEVAQSYLNEQGEVLPGPELAIIPSGSGGDFRKTLDLSGSIDEAAAQIRFGRPRAIDLGVLHAIDHQGRPLLRAFVNIASFGIGGAVAELVNAGPKSLGGRATYLFGTLRALATYKNVEVRIRVDGAAFYEGRVFAVAIANGRYFGGGMKIAPHADPTDGKLDVVVLGDMSRTDVIALAPKVYSGAHLGQAYVSLGKGSSIEAEPIHAWTNVLLDVDGEGPGRLPVRATVRPGALTIRG